MRAIVARPCAAVMHLQMRRVLGCCSDQMKVDDDGRCDRRPTALSFASRRRFSNSASANLCAHPLDLLLQCSIGFNSCLRGALGDYEATAVTAEMPQEEQRAHNLFRECSTALRSERQQCREDASERRRNLSPAMTSSSIGQASERC